MQIYTVHNPEYFIEFDEDNILHIEYPPHFFMIPVPASALIQINTLNRNRLRKKNWKFTKNP